MSTKILDTINWKLPPFEYQGEAITQGVKGLALNRFFAFFMEMGTGKTKCTLNTAEILKAKKYIKAMIILAPKPLMSTWVDEIEKHTYLDCNILSWDSNKVKTKTFQKDLQRMFSQKGKKFPVFIINVEAFQTKNINLDRVLHQFSEVRTLVALDESTKIKNPKANRTNNIIDKFDNQNFFKLILTGTEITNSLLDLYAQFEFLKKGFWRMRNFWAFHARYAMTIEHKTKPVIVNGAVVRKSQKFKKVVGFRRTEELHNKIDNHFYRALADDCLDLPERIYSNLTVVMNPEQKRVYTELKNNLFTEYGDNDLEVTVKMVLFGYFRQIVGGFFPGTEEMIGTTNPKFEALKADTMEYDGKVVVFANFVNEIKYITEELNNTYKEEVALPYYGEVKYTQREINKRSFIEDPLEKRKFLVINPATGSFGLNLQVASLMYWYGRSMSPEENWQGDKRIHRIGQKHHCVYKEIRAKGSVDTKLNMLLTSKTNLKKRFQTMTLSDIYEMI